MSVSCHLIAITFLGILGFFNLQPPTVEAAIQGQDRIIEKPSSSKEPVKIRAVKAKKGEIKLGEKFVGPEDWFNGLTIDVENIADKAITHISILMLFPRPHDHEAAEEPPFGESLKYGLSPYAPITSIAVSNQVQPIQPGGSINLTLSEELYVIVKQFLKKNKYPASIKKIELSIEDIGFIDGTAWRAGQLWRRDPSNPEKWVPVEQPQVYLKSHAAKIWMSNLFHTGKLLPIPEPLSIRPQIQESVCGLLWFHTILTVEPEPDVW